MKSIHSLRLTILASALACCNALAADVVVVMAPGSNPLTKDQVAAIYLGRNMDFKPMDFPSGTPARDVFYKKVTERDEPQIKAVWSRIIFTGKGQAPKEIPDASAMKKAVAADPKAIGYMEKSAVDGSVKVVFVVD